MASTKPCCCVSNRMATLLFLYFFLIGCVWSIFSLFTNFENATTKELIKGYSYIFYSSLFVQVIGGFIFLATIISISTKKRSVSLLYSVIGFLILRMFFSIFIAFLSIPSDEDLYDKVEKLAIEQGGTELTSFQQDILRNLVKEESQRLKARTYGILVISSITAFYAILVFYCYLTDLKGNPTSGIVVGNRVEDREANFSATAPGYPYSQTTAPQNSATMPPQNSAPMPHYFTQPTQYVERR